MGMRPHSNKHRHTPNMPRQKYNTLERTHPFGAGVNLSGSRRRWALLHVLGLEAAEAVKPARLLPPCVVHNKRHEQRRLARKARQKQGEAKECV